MCEICYSMQAGCWEYREREPGVWKSLPSHARRFERQGEQKKRGEGNSGWKGLARSCTELDAPGIVAGKPRGRVATFQFRRRSVKKGEGDEKEAGKKGTCT